MDQNRGPKAEAWGELKTRRLAAGLDRAATEARWTKRAFQNVVPTVNDKNLQAYLRGYRLGLPGTAALTDYLGVEIRVGSLGELSDGRLEFEVVGSLSGDKLYLQSGVIPTMSFKPRAYSEGLGSAY